MKKRGIVVILLLFHLSIFAKNQDIDTTLHLREVVVTGSKTERNIRHTPGRIEVITPIMLKHTPALSVDDILSMMSGVNTTRSNGISEMHTNVSIRGLSGNEQGRTLVLFDGIPINTSDEGSVNWNSLHINNIQRIEVFKGPGSSLYGNNAMGGVINIISKKAYEPLSVNTSVTYGSLDTWLYSLSISSKINQKISLFISGYYNRSDGFNNIPDSSRANPDYSVARYMKEGGVYGKILYTPTDLFNIDVAYDLYKDKRGEGEKIKAPDGEYRHFNHHRVQSRFFGEKNAFHYNLAFYFQRQDYFKLDERLNNGNYQRFDVKSHRDDWGAILNLEFRGTYTHFSIGTEYKNGSVNGGDHYVTSPDKVLNKGTMTFISAFAQEELTILHDKFWLQLALRYDNAHFHKGEFKAIGENVADFNNYNGKLKSNRWTHFSPRMAIRFNPNKSISGYISYSQGFRASILDDLCRSGWMWVGPKIANPDLGPETLNNYEIGGTFQFFKNFSVAPSVYYACGKDFLYYIATGEKMWGKRDIYQRRNISKVHVKGAELDVNYSPAPRLNINVNYSYNESRIKKFKEQPELNNKILTYAPRHQVKGTLMWLGGFIDLTLCSRYKTKQYTTEDNLSTIPGFATWDIRVAKWFWGHRIYVGGEMTNIFDNRHMNTRDYISSGRLVNIKLAINISK